MAISRTINRKAPTQHPSDFFKCKQQGGTSGVPQKIGEKLKSGPVREQIMGRKDLA
jgi:hypothetical protein